MNRVGTKEFKILKFIINNNAGTVIQCYIYDQLIDKFESKITLNQVNL